MQDRNSDGIILASCLWRNRILFPLEALVPANLPSTPRHTVGMCWEDKSASRALNVAL
jgi:hypothetical protein